MSKIEKIDKRSVTYNGWLSVDGANIVNERNKTTQLVGVSSHGIQWFGDLYSDESLTHLKKDLGINVFRISVYPEAVKSSDGLKRDMMEKVYKLIDESIKLDIYAVIDWHVLGDGNPQTDKTTALDFFRDISAKYADAPNVIYEICNEPNGEVEWEKDIRPYAVEAILAIRDNSPKSLVIVGTPDWSKDLLSVTRKPLDEKNVAYAVHFYAGSHNVVLRDDIDAFREKGMAVFVSECGATDSTGKGRLYEEAFERWASYMNEKKISWIYWSYSNKNEASAMLKEDVVPSFDGEDATLDEFLSPSGELFKRETEKFRK